MRGVSVSLLEIREPVGGVVRVRRVVGPSKASSSVGAHGMNASVIGPESEVPVLQVARASVVGGNAQLCEVVPGLLEQRQPRCDVLLVINRDLSLPGGAVVRVARAHAGGHLAQAVSAVSFAVVDVADAVPAVAVVVGDQRVAANSRQCMPGRLREVGFLSDGRLHHDWGTRSNEVPEGCAKGIGGKSPSAEYEGRPRSPKSAGRPRLPVSWPWVANEIAQSTRWLFRLEGLTGRVVARMAQGDVLVPVGATEGPTSEVAFPPPLGMETSRWPLDVQSVNSFGRGRACLG